MNMHHIVNEHTSHRLSVCLFTKGYQPKHFKKPIKNYKDNVLAKDYRLLD